MDESTVNRIIGDNLKRARERAGVSQATLAPRMGTSDSELSRMEGGNGRLTALQLWRACDSLGVAPDALFEGLVPTGLREEGAAYDAAPPELRALEAAAGHLRPDQLAAVAAMLSTIAPRPRGRGRPRGSHSRYDDFSG